MRRAGLLMTSGGTYLTDTDLTIKVDLKWGNIRLGVDEHLTYDYVKINAEYET